MRFAVFFVVLPLFSLVDACLVELGAASRADQAKASAARRRVFGKVRDVAGKPWVGAEVVFVTTPVGYGVRFVEADIVRALSDDKGRFEAQLLGNRLYYAWAWSKARDGAYRVSNGTYEVFAGEPVSLKQTASTHHRVKVAIEGREHHVASEPLRFEAGAHEHVMRVVEPGEDGSLRLPRVPGGDVRVRVFGRNGEVIARAAFSTLEPRGKLVLRRRGVEVPALVKVISHTGRSLSGVELWTYDSARHTRELVAKTDDDGMAIVSAGARRRRDGTIDKNASIVLLPRHPEHAEFFFRVRCPSGRKTTATELRRAGKPDTIKKLGPGRVLKGRLLGADGKALAKSPLLYWVDMRFEGATGSLGHPRRFVTDAEGRFALPAWNPECPFRIGVPVGLGMALGKHYSHEAPLYPIAIVASGGGDPKASGELGDLSLEELVPIDVRVAHAGGVPLASSIAILREKPLDAKGWKVLGALHFLLSRSPGQIELEKKGIDNLTLKAERR